MKHIILFLFIARKHDWRSLFTRNIKDILCLLRRLRGKWSSSRNNYNPPRLL